MALRVSLVNLQKLTLWAWRRARQHADVGAGAEHPRLAGAQQDDAHLRVLEAQPLQRVGELDVDAEIVGVELELVALEQAALLVDVHGQRRDVAVDRELPVPIARRIGRKVDPRCAPFDSLRSASAMRFLSLCIIMHHARCLRLAIVLCI